MDNCRVFNLWSNASSMSTMESVNSSHCTILSCTSRTFFSSLNRNSLSRWTAEEEERVEVEVEGLEPNEKCAAEVEVEVEDEGGD